MHEESGHRAFACARALAERLHAEEATDPARSCEKALLFAHLSTVVDDGARWASAAVRHLNAAIDHADAFCALGEFGLFGGLAGLGWAVERIARLLGNGADLNADTDAALVRELERGRWRRPFDLEEGIAGIGVYFLERLPSRPAGAGIRLVVDHLEANSPALPSDRSDVMRGLPGVMHLLAGAIEAGVEDETARRLLERFADSTLDRPAAKGCGSALAAAVFLRCARVTGRPEFARLAEQAIDRSLAVSPESIGEPSLRNGAAGVAHALLCAGEMMEDRRCLDRSRQWLERTLALLDARATTPGLDGDLFLDGDCGVALALLSASTAVDRAWDRRVAGSGFGERS